MNSYFYVDEKLGYFKTWNDLIIDLNELKYFTPYSKDDNDYYKMFLQIISSLLLNVEISFFEKESVNEKINFSFKFNNKKLLIDYVLCNCSKWKITLSTSGTTGIPKKVTHSLESIIRFVKKNEFDSVWGLSYNPTHIAGIQVFFQSFLNGNSIIRLFGLNKNEIYEQINKYQITHISSTPTFYKLLLPTTNICESVIRLSCGGEKFDQEISKLLKEVFPNSKINNIYASTEFGTLFSSNDEIFSIKNNILDKIKIIENQLFVHKSLLGEISEIFIEDWYNTGDLVDIISESPLMFKFVGRKKEIINVGGYNVNPHQIEDVIKKHPNVLDVKVMEKKNSVLNIIVCDVVSKEIMTESDLRKYLQTKLQKYEIPRIINFKNTMSMTEYGKKKRI